MANSPQAKKRARQIERRTAVNKARKSRIRTFLRAVEEMCEYGICALCLPLCGAQFDVRASLLVVNLPYYQVLT